MQLASLRSLVFVAALTAAAASAASLPARPLGFTVEVTMSEQAAAEVAARGQRLTVAAAYYGEPTWANRKNTALDGEINLGREEASLPAAGGAAAISGGTVDRKRLGWIRGAPFVNVNVYSTGRHGPDNILDCGLYEGAVPTDGPREIACRLIGEGG